MSLAEEMAGNRKKSGLQEQIDENLRRVYREALEEQVPDRFQKLLEQLKQKGGK